MSRTYHHISSEERAGIMLERGRGASIREIARALGRAPSTISREVRRGVEAAVTASPPAYDATQAAALARVRRRRCGRRPKLVAGSALHLFVRNHLVHKRWSPEQIANRLRLVHTDDPAWQISHETIYAFIYAHPRGALKQDMVRALRQHKATRGLRRTTLAKGQTVPEALRIVHRPEAVAQRQLPGHWEGDFIKGKLNRSAVGTLVERCTRWVVLCRMDGCTATAALEGFSRQMKKLPAFLRGSLTYDRGSEMACHAELAKRLKLDIWFADPYAPWQRGSNENTNGLIRQFLPKGTDLSTVSQTTLNDIAELLNNRPRKVLGWKTPAEVMSEVIAEFTKRVALDS